MEDVLKFRLFLVIEEARQIECITNNEEKKKV